MSEEYLPKYAEVALSLPMDRIFHYRIPLPLEKEVVLGARVWVEFGNKDKVGYIVGFADSTDIKDVKPIKSVIDKEPIISGHMLELAKWIRGTYLCSLGQAIGAIIPSVLKKGKTKVKSRVKVKIDNMPLSSEPLSLNDEQKEALKSILQKIERDEYKAFLLHGITASGKTEIYLQAIEKVLSKNKTSIVLVPEIALTPQTVERFTARFGARVAVMHSALTGSMRYSEWKRIKDKEARIAIGARSAIFSPVENLGLIIVDEEHETSYKQEDVPRYHARDVALMRARLSNCPVILGSATPSLESYYLAKKTTGTCEADEKNR